MLVVAVVTAGCYHTETSVQPVELVVYTSAVVGAVVIGASLACFVACDHETAKDVAIIDGVALGVAVGVGLAVFALVMLAAKRPARCADQRSIAVSPSSTVFVVALAAALALESVATLACTNRANTP